jgi:hypothetical protein
MIMSNVHPFVVLVNLNYSPLTVYKTVWGAMLMPRSHTMAYIYIYVLKTQLRGLSPRANYIYIYMCVCVCVCACVCACVCVSKFYYLFWESKKSKVMLVTGPPL